MKTLNDHVILYDSECPMCDLYTNAFVKTQMLPERGRLPFDQADEIISAHHVDRLRACDEIALVNVQTGKVEYGIESLIHILSNRFHFLTPVFRVKFLSHIASAAYAFVSFNRKVIIPGDGNLPRACAPSFNAKYRVAYIGLTWLITSFILAQFAIMLTPLIPPTNFYREFLICGGQIIFQGAVVTLINRKKLFEYLGNMMTISFAGGILLLLALCLPLNVITAAGVFGSIVVLMFMEHLRRVKLLELPWLVSLSWVVYRLLILLVIL
jgi:hypothetical protein